MGFTLENKTLTSVSNYGNIYSSGQYLRGFNDRVKLGLTFIYHLKLTAQNLNVFNKVKCKTCLLF